MTPRRILFLTGTRADFGKLKPLMRCVEDDDQFECFLFVTGMHLMAKYGNTIREIRHSGFKNIFSYMNQVEGEAMEVVLANTIIGLSRYLHQNEMDLIVVHGDRVEPLAGATVGALRNILVAHVEGGEISGTVDELMRHAISKLSHVHFVASPLAKKRLMQLGENDQSIFLIGSPDVDVMLSGDLPSLSEAKTRYDIPFDRYSLATLHPVPTKPTLQGRHAELFAAALAKSMRNYVVVYPNNDEGTEHIIAAYETLKGNERIRLFPSLRFEYFLTLLKHADFVIGNSSAGIHEAPVYGVPTINIGSRQHNRFKHESIFDVEFEESAILEHVRLLSRHSRFGPCEYYGDGKSADKFLKALRGDVWNIANQKQFRDLEPLIRNADV